MKTIIRDVRVEAPLDIVFDFLVDPHNLPEIWPNIVEVKNVKKAKNNAGFNFSWAYRMADIQLEGKCESIEYAPYESLVTKSSKGLDSTITWRFNSAGQSTHVTLKFEYQPPASVLKQMDEEVLTEENEREVETVLQNLKNRLELQPSHV
jgi:uncharacterized membrane protein